MFSEKEDDVRKQNTSQGVSLQVALKRGFALVLLAADGVSTAA